MGNREDLGGKFGGVCASTRRYRWRLEKKDAYVMHCIHYAWQSRNLVVGPSETTLGGRVEDVSKSGRAPFTDLIN